MPPFYAFLCGLSYNMRRVERSVRDTDGGGVQPCVDLEPHGPSREWLSNIVHNHRLSHYHATFSRLC